MNIQLCQLIASSECYPHPKDITRLSQQLPFHLHFFLLTISLSDEWWTLFALGVALKFGKLPSKTVVTLIKTVNKLKNIISKMCFFLFRFLPVIVFCITILLLFYHNWLLDIVECNMTNILLLSYTMGVVSTVIFMNFVLR